MTELHESNVDRFHELEASESDEFIRHVMHVHSPFPVTDQGWDTKSHSYINVIRSQCIACQTYWPCATSTILLERNKDKMVNEVIHRVPQDHYEILLHAPTCYG
jgi:hypothetical protein